MNKLLSTISLSKRAGKLIMGFDVVKQAVLTGEAQIVLTASDLSERTLRTIRSICSDYEVEIRDIPITLDELWYEVSKRAGVLAISDRGFADKILSMLDCAADKEECIE